MDETERNPEHGLWLPVVDRECRVLQPKTSKQMKNSERERGTFEGTSTANKYFVCFDLGCEAGSFTPPIF